MSPGIYNDQELRLKLSNNQCVFITMTLEQPSTFYPDKK
ncbi:hypothetical protein PGR6_18150 [Pseudomonas sp. GR 6-02]|nr:hypothetical protein PGR6_18150 [Pseudomonas sp. GR 6-02]